MHPLDRDQFHIRERWETSAMASGALVIDIQVDPTKFGSDLTFDSIPVKSIQEVINIGLGFFTVIVRR
jgi:hypothetical protein